MIVTSFRCFADFFQHCFQSRSGKPLFLYTFCNVRINVCVSATFVCFIVNPTVTPSSDKSSFLHLSPSLHTFFCNLQNQHSTRAIGLRDSQWGKATKLDRFQDVFAFSLSPEQCRSILDRSQTTSWSDPGWIDPRSISKKCERSHSARMKGQIDLRSSSF